MTGQLELIPTEPKLTDRQQLVLEAVKRAGPDGLDGGEAGRLLRQRFHPDRPETRLTDVWDRADGTAVLKALQAKGLATYRRAGRGNPGGWHPADSRSDSTQELPRGMTNEIPY